MQGEAFGEIVFNTAMCGYQEIMTDPSYAGQIVTFTYPLIGNYGVQDEAFESRRAFCEAIVVRESSRYPSPWNAEARLNEFLEEQGLVGIEEVDTRALTRHIRETGELRAIVSTVDSDPDSLLEKVQRSPGLMGRDLASEVSAEQAYQFVWNADEPSQVAESEAPQGDTAPSSERGRVVVYDFGVKRGILRALARARLRGRRRSRRHAGRGRVGDATARTRALQRSR